MTALLGVPVLVFSAIVGGGIGFAYSLAPGEIPSEKEVTRADEISALNVDVDNVPPKLDEVEPEEFHTVAQYAKNLSEYREAISSLKPFKHWQRNRQAEILATLETREWNRVGENNNELCFQQEKEIECIGTERFEQLREQARQYAESHPRGFGICYDWFEDVCMSGEWFESRDHFQAVLSATQTYVMSGEWPLEIPQEALEDSPTYEPTRSVAVLESGLLTEEGWREYQRILWPDREVEDLIVTHGFDGNYGGKPEDKAGVEQWYKDNPEAFCIGSAMDGDCFESQQHFEEAMKELEEWQNSKNESPAPGDGDDGGEPAPDSGDDGGEPAPDSGDDGGEPAPDSGE